MRLEFAALCDYAGMAEHGKPMIVGMFKAIYRLSPSEPSAIPPFYLAIMIEENAGDMDVVRAGTAPFLMTVRILDPDSQEMGRLDMASVRMASNRSEMPISAFICPHFSGMLCPPPGPYSFEIRANDAILGSVPFHVFDATPRPFSNGPTLPTS